MRPEVLDALPRCGFSVDFETHRFQPGLALPPIVCGSLACVVEGGAVAGELALADEACAALEALLDDQGKIIIGAHIQFDLGVAAVRAAKHGRDILPKIFAALEDNPRVYCALLAQALDDNASGMLGKDQRTGGPLRNPRTREVVNRHGLETVCDVVLGRTDAKARDAWRQRYAELEGVPLHLWPPEARDYPVDDAVNVHDAALAQTGHRPKVSEHEWVRGARPFCKHCHQELSLSRLEPCRRKLRHRNLHSLSDQVAMGFAMQLGAAWGFRVNQARVDDVEREIVGARRAAAVPLVAHGFLRANGDGSFSKNTAVVARAVAEAFGASGVCPACDGSGRVVSETKAKRKSVCPGCGVQPVAGRPGCERCGVGCSKCSKTGFDLSTSTQVTMTDPSDKHPDGQVSGKRDVLYEAGDERLTELASYEEDAKTETVYIPYLRRARRCVECGGAGTDKFPHRDECSSNATKSARWLDVPLTLQPNVFLETDRVSYGGSIHQFPRKGDLRSCIEARPGYVLCSCDYEAGEMITHAQSCLWICGFSDLAKALLTGEKPHESLGAQLLGISYDEFCRRYKAKEQLLVDIRQAMKPINFANPGGGGPGTMAYVQRLQGPDTIHPNGPMLVWDEATEQMVRGWKGLRFCVLVDKRTRCGDVKIREWNRRPLRGPTCQACVECAHRLRDIWFNRWTENCPYFSFVSDAVDNGQPTFADVPLRAGLAPWPRDGGRLQPGQVSLHLSRIIRGGVGFTDGANGYFQALLAFAAKRAFRRIQRECFDRSVRVPARWLYNSKESKYARGSSPLFGSRAIFLAHDESIVEHPLANSHHGAMRQSEIMIDSFRAACPDMAEVCDAQPALMTKWLKGAAPKYLRGGKKPADDSDILIPWDSEIAA